jgi:molecular chaperone GrpE
MVEYDEESTPRDGDESRERDGVEPGGVDADVVDPELEELQREVSGLTDRHLRLAAEFDNYRKRTERERAELYARAQADLVKRLLEGIDDLERVARLAETSSANALLEGVVLIEKKLLHALRSAGLEAIDPAGEPFDPESMEALGVVPTNDEGEDDLVADVFQKGYRFGSLLVRPARVRVHQFEG